MDNNNESGDVPKGGENPSAGDAKDFYTVLGVPKNATEKQISGAYKKLALKYHPDRNQDNEEAAVMFKSVSEAYHVLIDPNKRRQYDLGGEKAAPSEFESVDVTSLGGIGRVFGAMISRLGVPIATQIAPEIIEAAHNICRDNGLEGGGPPLDPRVSDLAWGWAADHKVDRQSGAFFRITVDSRHVENGFVVLTRAQAKGKFKLILFDAEGSVLYQEESGKPRDKSSVTQAALYFTNFDAYRLGEPSLATLQDKETPQMFGKLESFGSCRHQIAPGQYLVCVYGDNFIGKTHFSIVAVQAKNDAPEVTTLEETDEALLESKKSLDALRTEFTAAKAAYESVIARMKTESDKVDELLATRDKAYNGFFDSSIKSFSPSAASSPKQEPHRDAAAPADASGEVKPEAEATSPQPSLGAVAFSTAASAATTAASVGASAAQTATAAGGWLARRLSMGIQSIARRPSSTEEDIAAHSASQPAAHSEPVTEEPAGWSVADPAPEEEPAAAAQQEPAAVSAESPAVSEQSEETVMPTPAEPADAASSNEDAPAVVTRPSVKPRKNKGSKHAEEPAAVDSTEA